MTISSADVCRCTEIWSKVYQILFKKCLNQILKSILTLKNILFFFVESYFLFVRMKKKPRIESTLRSLIVSNLFTKFKYENERDNGWNY